VGDGDLIIRMLRAGVRMDVLRRYTSAFVDNGENLSLQSAGGEERKALRKEAPRWVQALHPAWVLLHRLRRFWSGIYSVRPFAYDIYTQSSPQQRVHFEVSEPTFYWTARMKQES
jgi:hypothetical protein